MAYDYSDPYWGNGFSAESLDGMNPHNIELPPGRILIKIVEAVYKGLIEIPDVARKEPASNGIVISVGPGPIMDWERVEGENYMIPVCGIPLCKVGQVVMFAQHVGVPMSFDHDRKDEVRYRILRGWDDVLAVFTPPEEEGPTDG